jgi:hypothetical protein
MKKQILGVPVYILRELSTVFDNSLGLPVPDETKS